MNLKDIAWILTGGVLAILFAVVRVLSYLFIEKGLLLVTVAGIIICYLIKFLISIL